MPNSPLMNFSNVPTYLYVLVALPLALYLLRRPIKRWLTPKGIPGIPAYPDPRPIFGDAWRLAKYVREDKSISKFFDGLPRDLGPVAQVRLLFGTTYVCLTDYAETEYILTRCSTVDRGNDTIAIFRTILPKALLALPTQAMWKHHRRIIGPAMTSKYLSLTTPRANVAAQSLIRLWRAKGEKNAGKSWFAESDLESATMDAICGMAFGDSWHIVDHYTTQVDAIKDASDVETGDQGEAVFHHTKPPLAESTWRIFETMPLMSPLPGLTHFFSRIKPSYRMHARRIRDYLDSKIRASRANARAMGSEVANENADNTLDLMTAKELRGDDMMSDAEMRDELFQYLLAGTETSGVTLSWWVKYMTNHPDIQRKLRRHILDRFPEWEDDGRQPTFEDLNSISLPYLEAVVYESLRMSRTAGGFTRQVTEDMVIMGYFIPKNTNIVMTTMSHYEDATSPVYKVPAALAKAAKAGKPAQHTDKAQAAEAVIDVPALNDSLASLRSHGASRKCGYWEAGTGLKFAPDRWLDADGKFDPNAGPWMPFSLGQRGCFGRNLAMLEMRLFMAQLTLAFFFAPVPENQNGFDKYETVATHPTQCFIRPVSWDDPLAQA